MNIIRVLLFCFLFITGTLAYSYELNGSMSHDGGGDYSVSVSNENGHEYNGEATDNSDGTLDVNVQDDEGNSYSGSMENNNDGTYDLSLQNDSSGGPASGTVELED